ncbi:exodeoxyribonuclease III [Demequina sp. B12]|uniref:exodeoxyribonuclease III n=1 Tax=Demequina sp. B12 TaxID=2992757 RepID=UPI00237C2D7B|nr:exodeoxyribonuclease III [Demequina sp. B12]MDE0572543.1 exodeoxyribonuclease III [Demequina sp. B12]
MRVASVNVNGVRASLRKGMLEWIEQTQPDVICLQEVRAPEDILTANFGEEWQVVQQVSEQKGRNGVAILARTDLSDPLAGAEALGDTALAATHTGRWVEATVQSPSGPVRVVSVYVHSGNVDKPESMADKYAFLDLMTERLAALAAEYEHVVVMGDINTAHTNNDIKNWKGNLKSAGFLPEERAYLDRWLEAGWVDTHRVHAGDQPGPYTWWSMRGKAFDNDAGWRIDYQLATPALAATVADVRVDRAVDYASRWSDHAPLVVDYTL